MAASASEALHRTAGDVYPLGSSTLTELSGGLKSGDVLELTGPAASGKTEVLFMFRLNDRFASHV